MTKTGFLRTFNHYTFQFVCFCFSLSVPRDSFPVRETFLGLCPVLNFYFSPLLLWYRSTGSLFGLLTELYCLSIINTNPTSQTSKWSKFFICCCVPSGAHSFYGLVVYGFIKTTFLPGFCLTEFFTFVLIYIIIYIMFIYSFIYSVTSFPVESWVSMPYEHREKPTKIYILYVSTHDTSVSLGHTFWVSYVLSTTS